MKPGSVVRALLNLILLSLSGAPSVALAAPRTPHLYIVVVDVSASRTPDMMSDAKTFLKQLIHSLSYGDRVALLQMQQEGLNDHPKRSIYTMPDQTDPVAESPHDRKQLSGEVTFVASEVDRFFTAPGGQRVLHTDILATMHIVDEVKRDASGRPATVILLSDMLQSAEGIEMEHLRKMPPPSFIPRLQKQQLMPSLPGACIFVIGADISSNETVPVRKFWQDYFRAAGTSLSKNNYRNQPPPAAEVQCN